MGKQVLKRLTLAGASLVLLLSGCSWLPDQIDMTEGWSANRLYTTAKEATAEGNYDYAVELLEKLQARYPFGRYAQQAQIELIYAYYKDNEPDLAIASADRFIRTYPRHPVVDYAYYLKGLTNFNRGVTAVEKLFPNDPAKTDTEVALQSFNDFSELVQRFPDSRYAEDARQRMVFLRNNLAAYEVNVADFYLRRGAYVAAANRGKYVLENYQQTPAATDALAVMVRAYHNMGMDDLAADSLRVLSTSHPGAEQIAGLQALLAGGDRQTGLSLF